MKRTPQNICPHCDAGDPTSVITECNCEDPTPARTIHLVLDNNASATYCGVHRRKDIVVDDGHGSYRRGAVHATAVRATANCRACLRLAKQPIIDLHVDNQGSVVMLRPVSPRAQSWIHEHVDVPEWAWMGPRFAVEPRLVDDLLNGARDAGLTIANGF